MKKCRILLVGNSFPLSLVTRRITVEPVTESEFRRRAEGAEIHSFWGHANTLNAASDACGVDLTPRSARPVLGANAAGLPVLDNLAFEECWVVVPRYARSFRPEIGGEAGTAEIAGWNILKISWPEEEGK